MISRPGRWFLACGGVFLVAQIAGAQSLAEVARQEALRRQHIAEPGWVYNDVALKPEGDSPESEARDAGSAPAATGPMPDASTPGAPTDGPPGEPEAAPEPPADKRSEAQWRALASSIHERIDTLQRTQETLEHRLGDLRKLTNGRRESEAVAAFREADKVEDALGRIEHDLTFLGEAWQRFDDEARRAGVPRDWVDRRDAPRP